MADRDEFGAFLVGFLVGALSGAVAALLFAPQSGEETRAMIGERSIELRDRAAETSKKYYDEASQSVQRASALATETLETAKKKVSRQPAPAPEVAPEAAPEESAAV